MSVGERIAFSINDVGSVEYLYRKQNCIWPLLIPSIKINARWIEDLNVWQARE